MGGESSDYVEVLKASEVYPELALFAGKYVCETARRNFAGVGEIPDREPGIALLNEAGIETEGMDTKTIDCIFLEVAEGIFMNRD